MKHYRIITLIAIMILACVVICSCQGEQGVRGDQGIQGIQGESGADGRSPVFRENNGWLEWKYEDEDDSAWKQVYQLDNEASTRFDFVLNADCESYSLVGISNMTSTTIEIPAEYNGKPVTKISSVSPMNYSGVKEVIIPSSVTEIGKQAFLNCTALEKVTIPESVTKIGNEAFSWCSSLKEISMNVETIETFTFAHCTSLAKITLGEKTRKIADSAFRNCEALATIEFNDGLEEIGSAAFFECKALECEITIPASVKMIGSSAFTSAPITKLTFESAEHWVFHNTELPGSFVRFGKLDVSDANSNVALVQGHYGGMYTWQKGIAVGVSGGIEPFATVAGSSMGWQFAGFDIDLISEIEAELEDYIFGFVYIQDFDESFAGIDNGTYDIVISAMEYTSARAENYSTSTVYYTDDTSNYVIYGDKDDAVLMAQINEALAKIISGDKYATLKAKYGL